MLRVTVYLKSGAVAEFDARAISETADHLKCRLEFAPPDEGRRLCYLDRDDVSAVVVEERGDAAASLGAAAAVESVAVPETIRQELQEVLAVASVGAAGETEPSRPGPRRRRR